jgi:hypothetical protein
MKHSEEGSQNSGGNRNLHLVQAKEPSTTSQQQMDSMIAEGVLRYQELQSEMDRALFAKPQDVETLAVVMPKMQLLKERLASYGVRVH